MISIVIPVRNGGESFRRCLEAIGEQESAEEIEVIVVDSGSTDGTVEFARSQGAAVHEIPSSEFNHGETRNLGARTARGDCVVFTVDDALPIGSAWLDSLVTPLRDRRRSALAATFGRHVAYDHAPPYQRFYIQDRYGGEGRVMSEATITRGDARAVFSNVASAVRRSVLEEIPFASDIVIGEDAEWAQRALLRGYEIEYVPSAEVHHSHEYSLIDASKRYFDIGASSGRMRLPGHGGSPDQITAEGLRFVRREVRWLWESGHRTTIPAALAHEAARFVGYKLGTNHHRIPRRLRKRLSRTSVYWSD